MRITSQTVGGKGKKLVGKVVRRSRNPNRWPKKQWNGALDVLAGVDQVRFDEPERLVKQPIRGQAATSTNTPTLTSNGTSTDNPALADNATSTNTSPLARAKRRGYVVHGIFKLKIAYADGILVESVIEGIEKGAYEGPEARQARNLIAEGDRVIELGAGLGFLSALIMRSTKVGDYVAVEADPRLPDVIRRTHELNGVDGPLSIKPCIATCSEEMIRRGTVDFHVSKRFCASSLSEVGRLKHTVKVPVVPLTDIISERHSNVLLCDIEGAETDVFNGTDLGTIEKILMEIHPNKLGQSGVRQVLRNLDRLDFVFDTQLSSGKVMGFRKLGA